MEFRQEAISKIKIADDIITHFDSQKFEAELGKITDEIALIFPFPEKISTRISLENLQYEKKVSTEATSLLKDSVPVSKKKKLQFEIFINKSDPKNDLSLEINLVDLVFRSIGKEISVEYERRDLRNSFLYIFDNLPDEMFIQDLSGKILNVNKTACNKLGYQKEEILMKTPSHFAADEYKKLESQQIKHVIKEGKGHFESIQETKSGKNIAVEINAVIGTIHKEPAIFSIVRDISERKRKDKQLLKTYNLLNNVVKTGIVSFWEIDIESGNVGFDFDVDEFGFFTSRFAEEFDEFLEVLHPDDRDNISEEIRKCIEGEKDFCQTVHRGMTNSGCWEWFQSIGYVSEKDINGKPTKIDGLSININEKKKVEHDVKNAYLRLHHAMIVGNLWWWELELPDWKMTLDEEMLSKFGYRQKISGFSFNDFLEVVHPEDREKIVETIFTCIKSGYKHKQVDYRTDLGDGKWIWNTLEGKVVESDDKGNPLKFIGVVKNINERKINEVKLNEARIEAELANRAKTEFLATMSHELRTPLNSVIGFSQILIDRRHGEINDKQEKYIQNVLKSGKHLLNLINDILDVSRIEAGKTELMCKNIDIGEIIEDVKELVSPDIMMSKKEVEISIEENLPGIYADEGKMKPILYNLLSNAIKFTGDNGKIKIAAHEKESNVIISVSDDGIGIPEEKLEEIFLPFRQLQEYKNRTYSGSGLGLTLVKAMVELHEGNIRVSSEPGKGSTFTFTVPIMPEGRKTII